METKYIILESVATWVNPKNLLTVGASTTGGVTDKNIQPERNEFNIEGISLLNDEISEFWFKSLSKEDVKKLFDIKLFRKNLIQILNNLTL